MLRRAVLMLIFGAGLPMLALSYMALRSIGVEMEEEKRKAAALAEGAAKSLADRFDGELHHIEQSLDRNVRDALRTPENYDDPGGEAPLNAAGRALVSSLDKLRLSEQLVRQGFLVHGGRLLEPWVHRAPVRDAPDATENKAVADAIQSASKEEDFSKADQTLYRAYTFCSDPGLKAAIALEQADLAVRVGSLDIALEKLDEARHDPDALGLDQEPVYPNATQHYVRLVQRNNPEGALEALFLLLGYEADNRWGEDADARREYFEQVSGQAEHLVETLYGSGPSEARRHLHQIQQRFAFLSGFEESILRQIIPQVKPPQRGELSGPPLRIGITSSKETRLVSTIAFAGSVTTEPAVVTSARPTRKAEPRFLVGIDVDFVRLHRWAEGEIAAVASQTESSVIVAVRDSQDRLFAGSETLEKGGAAMAPFGTELPGWRVLAAPADPEAPQRAAEKKWRIAVALVATCALAAVGSFAFALRAAKREIEVAKVRTDLVRNVSHELRTPVASVQMLAEMLEEGGLDQAKQQEYFVRIARESRRLARMIENVLDLARIERGARKVEVVPLVLRETVENAITIFKEGEQGRAADVRLEDSTDGALVPLDAAAIEQVLTNLLSNAVKYSPPGTPIEVSCAVTVEKARIAVRDHGRGMSPEESGRLFNPFYRARPEDAQATGVGLGLVITRELVRLHEGELEVASTPGQGTTFTIVLPRNGT
ncbi:MAG TPA: HAMP domain-containing sensor histidine kinase [Planctomycetota bacterium]|nr:HAMP domain-containing sensor histidine kinase [Planctomycetota bacterium]